MHTLIHHRSIQIELFNSRLVNKYKSSFSSVVLITLPALLFLFLFLEVIFRFIIPAAEKPLAVYDQENRLLRSLESRRVTGTYSMGKLGEVQADWRTNNFGWNSLIDYSTEHTSGGLICIIGDSYIRALQVDVGKDIASQFRKKIKPEFEVYSFGHDGAPLSQYLHVSRYTKRHFRPDVFVYLLVHNDFEESIANFVHKPYFLQIGMTGDKIEEIQPTTQRLYQFLTYSATFRYLFYNLDLASIIFSFKQSPDNYNANTNVKILSTRKDEIQRGTEYLLTKNQAENKGKRTIFMMNAPVNDIIMVRWKRVTFYGSIKWLQIYVKRIT